MSKTVHATPDDTHYRCPLDGSALKGFIDPGWWCPHHHGKGDGHHTILALDTERECVVEQLGGGKVPVLPAEYRRDDDE